MKYGLWKTFATQVKRIKEGQISYVYVIYIINALASGVIPVIGVFFIKIIIDEITMSNSIDGFLFKMLILIVISTICLVLKSILEGILSGKFLLLRQKPFGCSFKICFAHFKAFCIFCTALIPSVSRTGSYHIGKINTVMFPHPQKLTFMTFKHFNF